MDVMERTRVLGLALIETKEYVEMREAELCVARDEEAHGLMDEFDALRMRMAQLLAEENGVAEEIVRQSEEMRALQMRMQSNDLLRKMGQARSAFSQLLEKVNDVLRFIVTGETEPSGDSEGCGGSCKGCSGCQLH